MRFVRFIRHWFDARKIVRAQLFDANWYLATNPDLHGKRINPILHFLNYGVWEGRSPNPLFDTKWYLAENPDIARARLNPLLHYINRGAAEGRNPSPVFDTRWYAEQNPGVAATGNPLTHFFAQTDEARSPHPLFDTKWYLERYPDVAAAGTSPLTHYFLFGTSEGRDPNPLFDSDWYLAQYPDVAKAGINPLAHFIWVGAAEGRDPNPWFDTNWYFSQNPELAASGENPLAHYQRIGARQHKDPHPLFDTEWYLAQCPEIIATGVNPLFHFLCEGQGKGRAPSYRYWIAQYDSLSPQERGYLRKTAASLAPQPLILVTLPAYGCAPRLLEASIQSVKDQLYSHWRLKILVSDMESQEITKIAEKFSKDPRIKVAPIVGGSLSPEALDGDFVTCLQPGDTLSEVSLFWIAKEIADYPNSEMIFSDEDQLDNNDVRSNPYFKTDWNPALSLSRNAVGSMIAFKRSLLGKVGGLPEPTDSIQQYDLVLRCTEVCDRKNIRHIPRLLYHRRGEKTVTTDESQALVRAIEAHLKRRKVPATVRALTSTRYQVDYHLPLAAECPLVSVIIPTAFKNNFVRDCLHSLLERTTYPNFEILIAVNNSSLNVHQHKKTLEIFKRDARVVAVPYSDKVFNYSKINNLAAGQAKGTILCLLNDDTVITTAEWLERLVARVQLDGVGAAGALLLYPDGTIQHAGVITGLVGLAGHPFSGRPKELPGYFGRAQLEQDLSCVTAACMVLRKEVFAQVGGFNEALAVAYNDVDLCLRIRDAGWRIIWTPTVQLIHRESVSVGSPNSSVRQDELVKETKIMKKIWGNRLLDDPFYNPNLSLDSLNFAVACPPRIEKLSNSRL